MSKLVLSFEDLSIKDKELYGGKAAGLGELTSAGIRVPPGFCISGDALGAVLEANDLVDEIARIAASLNFEDYLGVEERTSNIRALIASARMPAELDQDIR